VVHRNLCSSSSGITGSVCHTGLVGQPTAGSDHSRYLIGCLHGFPADIGFVRAAVGLQRKVPHITAPHLITVYRLGRGIDVGVRAPVVVGAVALPASDTRY